MRFQCSASPECLRQIRDWLRQQLGSRLPAAETDAVCLAVDEAAANIVRHAYGEPQFCPAGGTPLVLELEIEGGRLRVLLRDQGQASEPQELCGRELTDVRPGGLGWHFIRSAFPRSEYRPKTQASGWNELELIRDLSSGSDRS